MAKKGGLAKLFGPRTQKYTRNKRKKMTSKTGGRHGGTKENEMTNGPIRWGLTRRKTKGRSGSVHSQAKEFLFIQLVLERTESVARDRTRKKSITWADMEKQWKKGAKASHTSYAKKTRGKSGRKSRGKKKTQRRRKKKHSWGGKKKNLKIKTPAGKGGGNRTRESLANTGKKKPLRNRSTGLFGQKGKGCWAAPEKKKPGKKKKNAGTKPKKKK